MSSSGVVSGKVPKIATAFLFYIIVIIIFTPGSKDPGG